MGNILEMYPVRGGLADYDLAAVRKIVGARRHQANAIRLARQARGLTVPDLAAALGVDRRTVSRWESGAGQSPRSLHLGPLVDALGVTADTFMAALNGGPALAQLTAQALATRRRAPA